MTASLEFDPLLTDSIESSIPRKLLIYGSQAENWMTKIIRNKKNEIRDDIS